VIEDKTHAELTIPAAGDYVVSIYGPADKAADASIGLIDPLTVEFATARRDEPRLFRLPPRAVAVDAADLALLRSRTHAERSLRAMERLVLQTPERFYSPESTRPARETCTAAEFKYKDICYGVGEDLPALIYSFGGGVSVTVTVKKVVGSTALLVDKADTAVAQSDLDKLADEFDTIAGPRDRQIFNQNAAHTGTLDTDGNAMLGVVLSSKVGTSGIAGLFDVRDVLNKAPKPNSDPSANGNESDLMWATLPGSTLNGKTVSVALIAGTLAHEYQHMINLARARTSGKTETVFLNEALSHLAEDLTGYGASNLSVIGAYLAAPSNGLFLNDDGADNDDAAGKARGIGYLYLRYLFEKAGGYAIASDGKITDQGGIAFVEKLMTGGTKNGLESLSAAGGSFFKRFALFFPTLSVSQNSADAPLVATDCRFNFDLPTTDPLTQQLHGLKLNDPMRANATGQTGLLAGYQTLCSKDDAEAGTCKLFMTGGHSFIWTAAANDKMTVKGASDLNLRVTAIKVK
jgi:hypothetical protein